uniref:Thiamine pyrimidine synthase n=3 Tax=Lotharella globosa TaxID=91324 RepID=A0A7S4DNE4_9EUKA
MHGYGEDDTMAHGSVVSSYLKADRSDSTWIFTHWEAVKAMHEGTHLNLFTLEDYGIPYGYSPVLLATESTLDKDPEVVRKTLNALEKGYRFAYDNPIRAAEILVSQAKHPSLDDLSFIEASQLSISDKYLTDVVDDDDEDEGVWGVMELNRWSKWVDFLFEKGIIVDRDGVAVPRDTVQVEALFTNEFLPTYTS